MFAGKSIFPSFKTSVFRFGYIKFDPPPPFPRTRICARTFFESFTLTFYFFLNSYRPDGSFRATGWKSTLTRHWIGIICFWYFHKVAAGESRGRLSYPATPGSVNFCSQVFRYIELKKCHLSITLQKWNFFFYFSTWKSWYFVELLILRMEISNNFCFDFHQTLNKSI